MKLISLATLFLTIGAVLGGCSDGDSAPDSGPAYRGEDLCLSATDMEILSWRYLDAGVPDAAALDIAEVAKECVRGPCLSAALDGVGVESCMQDCLDSSAVGAASADCQGCFIDTVACAQENCVLECLGSDTSACDLCLREYCVDGLDTCTGLPSPP